MDYCRLNLSAIYDIIQCFLIIKAGKWEISSLVLYFLLSPTIAAEMLLGQHSLSFLYVPYSLYKGLMVLQ